MQISKCKVSKCKFQNANFEMDFAVTFWSIKNEILENFPRIYDKAHFDYPSAQWSKNLRARKTVGTRYFSHLTMTIEYNFR